MHALRNVLQSLVAGLALACGLSTALAALPIEHWRQASGARIYFVASRGIPMVDVQIDFDAGSRREPATQVGLANVTASMAAKGVLPSGGRPALDENQLGEAWADLGAGFGGDAGTDRMSFSMRSLTDPDLLGQAVDLASRQLGEPAYPQEVWTRERQRIAALIREADTRPGTVARKAFQKAVYGDHPYARDVTAQTLAAIGVADMRRFHQTYVLACRARVSIVGDLDRAGADALAARMLARLPQGDGCPELPPVREVEPLAESSLLAIPFESAQAHVLFGQPGFKRSDPDYFPLLVGNHILGGSGLVSRLAQEVREKRGLSYGATSYFSPSLHAGAFTVGLQTRPDQAQQALRVAQDVVADYVASGPTAAELRAAKDNLIGGFALRIDTNRKLLDNVASIAWNELPLDYLDTWTAQIARVTAQDVLAAMARKLHPGRMATVIVGGTPPVRP